MVSYCCITNYFQGQLLKTRIISLHCFQVPGSVAGSTDLGWAPFGTAEGLSGSAAGWVKLERMELTCKCCKLSSGTVDCRKHQFPVFTYLKWARHPFTLDTPHPTRDHHMWANPSVSYVGGTSSLNDSLCFQVEV